MARFKHGSLVYPTNTETLSENKTLLFTSRQVQFLDPNGSDRDVILPTESDSNGIVFYITNVGSANNLVIKDASPEILMTVEPGTTATAICNGVSWNMSGGGTVKTTERQTTNFQTLPFKRYKLAQNVEATLPQNPADDDWIMFASLENLEEEAATIKRYAGTTYKIMGKQEDLLYSSNIPFTLMYDSVYDDWRFA